MNKKIRVIIELDIDQESIDEKNISHETVLGHLKLEDSDVLDGFELYPADIPGINPTYDFLLCNGRIVSKEFI